MDRYAVFLDIDETLLHHGVLPDKNAEAISRAKAARHKILVNTGRSYGYIPDNVKALELDGFCAGIGSHIVCDGVTLKRVRLEHEMLVELLESCCGDGRACIIEGEDISIVYNGEADTADKRAITSPTELLTKYRDTHLTKVFFVGVLPEELQKDLSERFNFFQHGNYAEFSLKGCTKANSIKLVSDYLDIPISRCIAIGDSINDLDMLDYAGISVAMANAHDYIKKRCSYVTASAADSGVAVAIRRLLTDLPQGAPLPTERELA